MKNSPTSIPHLAKQMSSALNAAKMKSLLILAIALCAAGCHGWEYPARDAITRVENSKPVARFRVAELKDERNSRYVGEVIEVEGVVGHIVNKGGQPAVMVEDLFLTFGPKEKAAVGTLVRGNHAVFRGVLTRQPMAGRPGELRPAIVVQ